MTVTLEAKDVTKSYGDGRTSTTAVRGASLSLHEGEAVALVGPSGCGKSTLLRVLGLMARPTSGRVVVRGQETDESERARARLRNGFFGYVDQQFAIIDEDTVEQNVVIPLLYAQPSVTRADRRARAAAAVDQVGLGWALGKKAARLSGGERQRVAIARSLINRPLVVIADEPTAALDSTTGASIVSLLLSAKDHGGSVLVATHDERVAARCDRVVRMADGRLLLPPASGAA